jgi:hypothetical protein
LEIGGWCQFRAIALDLPAMITTSRTKSLERWFWDAARADQGEQDASK